MKRRREFIEKRLDKLQAKRARLNEQVRRLDRLILNEQCEIAGILELEQEARKIQVSVSTFQALASASRSAWKFVFITNVYDQYRDCECDCCWFGRNMDRLDELTLYTLTPMSTLDPLTICGVCMENGGRWEAAERAVRRLDEKKAVIDLDPDDFEDDLLATIADKDASQ